MTCKIWNRFQKPFSEGSSKKAFTYVELALGIVIVSVLSISLTYLVYYLAQNVIFVPIQMNVEMIASEAINIMIEGDDQAKGLRFSKSIFDIRKRRIDFINQDDQVVSYKWNRSKQNLKRSIDGAGYDRIPYYAVQPINIDGDGNVMFRYYDADGVNINPSTGNPADVARVSIIVVAKTGAGSYDAWDGYSEQFSSVVVQK